MDATRQFIVVARVVAVLAVVASVLAMHSLASGHHGEVAIAAVHVGPAQSDSSPHSPREAEDLGEVAMNNGRSAASVASVDHLVRLGTPCPGECAPGEPLNQSLHLLDVCLAILLAAVTTLLLWAVTSRRVCVRLLATFVAVRLTVPHVPRPTGPGLFTLGVLRT